LAGAEDELFVSSGYELTSVDAIAARAAVSKRTVYDHFGDKESLFRSVLARVNDALLAFVQWLTTETIPSSTYTAFRRLNARTSPGPRLAASEEAERMLEERFAQLAAEGELEVRDPRRAVQHFVALTMRLALDAIDQDPAGAVRSEIQEILIDGVDGFLRAYR